MYIFQADVYCDTCGQEMCERFAVERAAQGLPSIDINDPSSYDSDEFPKGPFDNSEETDCPQHCCNGADCLDPTEIDGQKYGRFLGNELTEEGVKYVQEAINRGGAVAEFWREEYEAAGYKFKRPRPELWDEFTEAYLQAALWSSTDNSRDDGGDPLDDNYGIDDISDECLIKMVEDCKAFQQENAADITEEKLINGSCSAIARAGHDFWLTRNHHGAGFWDGDWETKAGRRLTEASHVYGGVDLYVGDDGKIYC